MTDAVARSPHGLRILGHAGTALIGALLLVSGAFSFTSDLPAVLPFAQLGFGAAALGLAWSSWKGSRIGWAFAVALDGVLGCINLFGAPKVAHLIDIPIVVAGLPCVIAVASCIVLAVIGSDYDK